MLEFSLKRQEEKIKLDGNVYTLRELSGAERDKFLTNMSKRMNFGPDGKPTGLKSFDGVESDLIAMSLFAPDNTAVSVETIKSWPGGVQKALFSACQKLSGLDEQAESEAKNA